VRFRISKGLALTLVLTLAVAGGTWWLRTHTSSTATPAAEIHKPAQANYYARNAQITVMNKKGAPLYVLKTAKVLRYPDDSADMSQPRLHYFGAHSLERNQGDWHLRADRGHRPAAHRHRIRLRGHVVASGKTAKDVPLTLHTTTMLVFLHQKRLKTDAPVQVDSNKRTTTAVGMRGELATNQIQFMNNVHTRFTP
jgi:LPS export ABC transporter protein LptC